MYVTLACLGSSRDCSFAFASLPSLSPYDGDQLDRVYTRVVAQVALAYATVVSATLHLACR